MKVWFVLGFVNCSGPSFDERRMFMVRPYGVFSQGFVGTDIIALSLIFEATVQGFDTTRLSVVL